jgi:hypothetical protein
MYININIVLRNLWFQKGYGWTNKYKAPRRMGLNGLRIKRAFVALNLYILLSFPITQKVWKRYKHIIIRNETDNRCSIRHWTLPLFSDCNLCLCVKWDSLPCSFTCIILLLNILLWLKCTTAIKALFLYFNLCLSVKWDSLSCSFTSIISLLKTLLWLWNVQQQLKHCSFILICVFV